MKKDLFVRKSNIQGNGVFTKKSFKRGETIFILKGKPKKFIVKNKEDSAFGPNWIGIKTNFWLDPDGIYQYLNHSCNPNMGIKGSVTFVAMRDIKAGEELTFDYSITEDDMYWKFNCHCGERNCRRKLRSIQFLPQEVYKSYLPYIPSYFQKVYTKHHKSRHG